MSDDRKVSHRQMRSDPIFRVMLIHELRKLNHNLEQLRPDTPARANYEGTYDDICLNFDEIMINRR